MNLHRNFTQTRYSNGRVDTFDPFIRWHLQNMGIAEWIGEIGIRGDFAIGFMLGLNVGAYSTYKQRFVEIGRLTLYLHYGKCKPYNPRTVN